MAEISIIIPCYNAAPFIEKCLESVCGQTIADQLQIVLIDDGSTDGSADMARACLEKHGRLEQTKIIRLHENKGVANTRIIGIKAAECNYIMSVDADDWIDRTMCEKMLNKADKEHCDMVVCDYKSIKGEKVEVVNGCYKEPFLQQLILCNVTGSLWNKLVRRDIFIRPDFRFPVRDFSEDYAYCLQLAIYSETIGYVPEPFYNYAHHTGSVVRDSSIQKQMKRHEDDMENFRLDLEILEKNGLLEKFREEIIAHKLKMKNSKRGCRGIWRSTFPELWKEIFQSRYVSWRSRVAYFATLLKLK